MEPGYRAGVTFQLAAHIEKIVALVIRPKGANTQVIRERSDSILGGADPLAAQFYDPAIADVVVQHAASDPISGLQHNNGAAGFYDFARCREPGQACSHHDEVYVCTHLYSPSVRVSKE